MEHVYPVRCRGMPDEAPLTIDELARRTGMTVRNLRAHQSRGLLPAPEVRGRTGYYGPEHIARVELIKELQADGFNLESIRRLIENAGGSTSEVLRFTRAARETFEEEAPEIVTVEELAARWGEGGGAELLQRAIRLGLLRPLGDGRLEERSPRLGRAGAQLARLGVPVERSLDTLEALRRHADGVAHAYVALFLDEIWRPFDEAGRPPERWPAVMEALERLRPLATESLEAMFGLVMTDAVDEAVGAQLALETTRTPDGGS
jgi:DNA-binding transcriptional MerR regulator